MTIQMVSFEPVTLSANAPLPLTKYFGSSSKTSPAEERWPKSLSSVSDWTRKISRSRSLEALRPSYAVCAALKTASSKTVSVSKVASEDVSLSKAARLSGCRRRLSSRNAALTSFCPALRSTPSTSQAAIVETAPPPRARPRMARMRLSAPDRVDSAASRGADGAQDSSHICTGMFATSGSSAWAHSALAKNGLEKRPPTSTCLEPPCESVTTFRHRRSKTASRTRFVGVSLNAWRMNTTSRSAFGTS
mmetsp:Transcript_4192/g.14724  ORF Transcript_4192/g.14724 Transcript_4192/m.14724 type:complete len:248 (-) Transcript_4192:770-1513(-)